LDANQKNKPRIYQPKLPYIGLSETNTKDKEPKNVNEALLSPKWKAAIDAEFKALTANHTRTLIPFQGRITS